MLEKVTYKNIHQDSRLASAGDLFVAIPCDMVEAHTRQAIQNGATTVVAEPALCAALRDIVSADVSWLPVPNVRQALSQIASEYYPRQPGTMVAVTGTNGKTSVVNYIKQFWRAAGCKAGTFGTLGIDVTEGFQWTVQPNPTRLTTPDALTFHQNIQALSDSGISHCAFEASSHGLDQFRIHGARLKAAAFTNLTQDHLDYHPTMEAYFEAKARLFTEVLPPSGTAVLNALSPYEPTLRSMVSSRGQQILRYGIDLPGADLCGHVAAIQDQQMILDLELMGQAWKGIPLNVVGGFQVENILCAVGLAIATGLAPAQIVNIIPTLVSARGRMEWVSNSPKGGAVYIDYAHSPDAMERSLMALRHHVPKRSKLYVVFGCGGNRDAGKRAQMGKIAADLADSVIVTDDNPRDEDPAFIRAQVKVGCPDATEIQDRREAIGHALDKLKKGDILLIAGKGHEQGQIIGDRIIPFDDRTEVLSLLNQKMKGVG
jgi:UDP-N-acetylmuramoyl-L-alanyl-D-glutamate--2,6-diaminopimelate ligase